MCDHDEQVELQNSSGTSSVMSYAQMIGILNENKIEDPCECGELCCNMNETCKACAEADKEDSQQRLRDFAQALKSSTAWQRDIAGGPRP
jgi:hypothetical protein